MAMNPAIEMKEISKVFPGVVANERVNLRVPWGTIHAIVGENGAGKSTLMKILAGLERPTSGEIRVDGRPVEFHGPMDANTCGIGMVHQHFMLIPGLTVAENVVLGSEVRRGVWFDRKASVAKVARLAEEFGLYVDPTARVQDCPVGIQQRVEILKVLHRGARIMILDEPTAVLTPGETVQLFEVLRRLAEQGRTILFISHKLNEVKALCRSITVMRGGRVTGELDAAQASAAEISNLMVGRSVNLPTATPQAAGKPLIELHDVEAPDDLGLPAVRGVSLQVLAGEIVGLAGVAGNGQTELIEAITGLRRLTRGRVTVQGQDVTKASGRQVREAGLAHIPEDRYDRGAAARATLAETAAMGAHRKPPLAKGGRISPRAMAERARALIQRFHVKAAGVDVAAASLSGGNLQKLIAGRELTAGAPVLIAAQPTRGIDLGAIEFIHQQILDHRAQQGAVLLVSAELSEIIALSDRILVMYEGKIVGELSRSEATEEAIGLLMAGVVATEGKVHHG
jgi:general nucleoside transport system ATP-binding protein